MEYDANSYSTYVYGYSVKMASDASSHTLTYGAYTTSGLQ